MKIKVFPESKDPEVRRFDRMVEALTLLLFVTTTLLVCCSCSSTKFSHSRLVIRADSPPAPCSNP